MSTISSSLLNMATQLIRKFYVGFHLRLLPKNVHSPNSTNKNLLFFLSFPKDVHSRNSTNENLLFKAVPYWLPEYDCMYKLTRSFLSHLQQSMCDLF